MPRTRGRIPSFDKGETVLRDVLHQAGSRGRRGAGGVGSSAESADNPMAESLHTIQDKLEHLDRWGFRQLESIVALYMTLGISVPLPSMRRGATSPDFLAELVRVIARRKPRLTLELGGGVSTIVTAYALERNSLGTVVTLEHDADWVTRVRGYLEEHHVSPRASVVHSPLTRVDVAGRDYEWYDLGAVEIELGSIDLLVIDGPPAWGEHDPMSRYPALPLLAEYLSDDAIIVQDDADRRGEREGLRLWNETYGPLEVERPEAEKGMTVIHWMSRRQR